MYRSTNPRRQTLAALAAGTLVAGMASMLILGLRVTLSGPRLMSLVAVSLVPPPPEPDPPPPPARSTAPRGAQSPADQRNRASPVLAAPNPLPSAPVVAAREPGEGDAAQSGAADRAGPGEGAGGTGDGTGGGGAIATGPVQVRGRLSVDDFPFGLIGPGERASVRLRYVVETDGRVSTCRILRSSGFAEVDAMACRLIEQRFRYRPARNAAGDPVRAGVEETHTWFRRDTPQTEPRPQGDTVQLLRTN